MPRLTGKIVEASTSTATNDAQRIGVELRRLRVLSGLTQDQIAKRMHVQQAAISKIEKGGDVFLSTVQRYMDALGASLRVEAQFTADSPLSIKLNNAFDIEHRYDDRLVLPLLGDDSFKSQRDVVLSIKPVYSEKILDGRKTVELRRRFPMSASSGTLAYIYATSPIKAMVGAAEIRDVLRLPVEQIWRRFKESASIDQENFDKYFYGVSQGFVLVLSGVKSFSRPLPLSELREKYGFEPPQSFLYAKNELRKALRNEPAVVSN